MYTPGISRYVPENRETAALAGQHVTADRQAPVLLSQTTGQSGTLEITVLPQSSEFMGASSRPPGTSRSNQWEKVVGSLKQHILLGRKDREAASLRGAVVGRGGETIFSTTAPQNISVREQVVLDHPAGFIRENMAPVISSNRF